MVVAAAIALWNAFISGRPMVAVSLRTISSNGLDETTLTLRSWTSIVGISLAPTSLLGSRGEKLPRAFLNGVMVVHNAFVNVRRWRAIDQQTRVVRAGCSGRASP